MIIKNLSEVPDDALRQVMEAINNASNIIDSTNGRGITCQSIFVVNQYEKNEYRAGIFRRNELEPWTFEVYPSLPR